MENVVTVSYNHFSDGFDMVPHTSKTLHEYNFGRRLACLKFVFVFYKFASIRNQLLAPFHQRIVILYSCDA